MRSRPQKMIHVGAWYFLKNPFLKIATHGPVLSETNQIFKTARVSPTSHQIKKR
jgi:hypothetical protein